MKTRVDTMVSKRICEVRLKRDYSQKELARRAGYSMNTIWNIENGKQKVNLQNLYRIAKALKVAPRELLPAKGARAV